MAWIESHTVLMRHRKVALLALSLKIRRSYAVGHLHALWHAALEQQDDGDLSGWPDEFIAECSDFPGDAADYVKSLQKFGWLDERLIHDWPDYAGRFLMNKYASSNREKLEAIWAKHGRQYGKQVVSNRSASGTQANSNNTLPTNHTNHTNQPRLSAADECKRKLTEKFITGKNGDHK